MTKLEVKQILERVLDWPANRQAEAVELLLALESHEGEFYHPSDEEQEAVERGLSDARQGALATDAEMEAILRPWRK